MSRTRKQDAWVASVRISIPIDATKPSTIAAAQERVRALSELIPGCSVEITHAGFGRMAAPAASQSVTLSSGTEVEIRDGAVVRVVPATQEPEQPEIPSFLRRNGAGPSPGSPLDPSGDGSLRGPDGAA